MFTKMAHEAFMKLKQVRRRSWGGLPYIYIYIKKLIWFPRYSNLSYWNAGMQAEGLSSDAQNHPYENPKP